MPRKTRHLPGGDQLSAGPRNFAPAVGIHSLRSMYVLVVTPHTRHDPRSGGFFFALC